MLDSIDWQTVDMKEALSHLLDRGANSLLFHGNRAKEAEYLADEIRDRLGRAETNNVIITISSTDQSLSEFLGEATLSIMPAANYLENWVSDVFFCVAGTKQARNIAELLR